MSTKNILLSALALAIFAAPAFAQNWDYHDLENLDLAQHVSDTIKTPVKASVPQKKYLDTDLLRACIYESFCDAIPDLLERAKNSIQDKKITAKEQQELIDLCVENNQNEVLNILLKAGFTAKAKETKVQKNTEGTINTENKCDLKFLSCPRHNSIYNKSADQPTETGDEDAIDSGLYAPNKSLISTSLSEEEYHNWLQGNKDK